MALETVKAKTNQKDAHGKVIMGEDGKPVSLEGEIEFDFGGNLAESTKMFGDDVVFSLYKAQAVVQCQAAMRRELVADNGDVSRVATSWKPGVKLERVVDPAAVAKAHFATLSDADKKAFLKQLQG